ncbi:hypothetical protein F5Y12DRAFT_773072 [Xylaria sp. FL1777]|nr:hypothetical protein F5Y12DRAFT_773072 [Xylaria sp. FL1777]
MDPLSALSLAGTVVQFVQFAVSLINGAKRIYVTGHSIETETLDGIYRLLSGFSSDLGTQCGGHLQPFPGNLQLLANRRAVALGSLAARCKQDCDHLLAIVNRLKTSSVTGPRWWASFIVALKEVAKAKEVKELQERIEGYQSQMVLHLCAISNQAVDEVALQVHELCSMAKKAQVQRREQLESLENELHQLRAQIANLSNQNGKTSLSRDEIDMLTTRVSMLSVTGKTYAKEHSVLADLDYDRRRARHAKIHHAHQSTFNWVFDNASQRSRAGKEILAWLEHGNGTFWVSGKPGAGKSTFMKFVADHPNTGEALRHWAFPDHAILACHYFDLGGTPIQRSLEGLLRSLLYHILRQAPGLISTVLPERWREVTQDQSNSSKIENSWTLTELQDGMSKITEEVTRTLKVKICFFIDGLDEFSGDHIIICRILKDLCKSSKVKIFFSSRPWNVFEENFGAQEEKLCIHNLTKQDIRNYVESQLHGHPRWSIMVSEAESAVLLVTEVTERAHGVFLWVYLAARLLQEGMTNYDTIDELRQRLDAIPDDLESFFQHIMDSVDAFYREKMANYLLMAMVADGPLPFSVYVFHEQEYNKMTYATRETMEDWDETRWEALRKQFYRRLNSRCKGLLEINGTHVEFLHRTVSDFLRTRDMWEFLCRTAKVEFDPCFSIFQGYAALIKHSQFIRKPAASPGPHQLERHLVQILNEALPYSRRAQPQNGKHIEEILDDLEWSVETIFQQARAGNSSIGYIVSGTAVFRECAVGNALYDYVMQKLQQHPDYFAKFRKPPLAWALDCEPSVASVNDPSLWSDARLKLIQRLFQLGHSLNQTYRPGNTGHHSTPWSEFCAKVVPTLNLSKESLPLSGQHLRPPAVVFNTTAHRMINALSHGVFRVLLESGADANTSMLSAKPSSPMPIWASFLLASFENPELLEAQEIYIEVLDFMMRKSNLNLACSDLQLLLEEALPEGRQTETALSAIEIPKRVGIQARTTMMKFICLFLDHLLSYRKASISGGDISVSRRGSLLTVKAIRVFMEHAAHPLLPLHVLEAKVELVFPSLCSPLPCLKRSYDENYTINTFEKGMDTGNPRKRRRHRLEPIDS